MSVKTFFRWLTPDARRRAERLALAPLPYCVADYVKHSYRGTPSCVRCGAENPRYRLPDLLADAREEARP